jgi:hypothetical protein
MVNANYVINLYPIAINAPIIPIAANASIIPMRHSIIAASNVAQSLETVRNVPPPSVLNVWMDSVSTPIELPATASSVPMSMVYVTLSKVVSNPSNIPMATLAVYNANNPHFSLCQSMTTVNVAKAL